MKRLVLAAMLFSVSARAQEARNVVFPADSRVANVTKAPYNAIPDDDGDDTLAIQMALTERRNIVYLPKGTYRITKGLQMISQIYFGVIGEHPDNTIIKWDGVPGGTLLFCNGARYGRFGRITWDGSG